MSEYGYKGAQCYYWYRYDDGRMQISNGEWNYFRKKYDGEWDYKKTQKTGYYYEDGKRYSYKYWEYEYDENGNHPTVSGDGAALTGGKFDDGIHNEGKSANIKGNAGNDYIYNNGDNVTIDGGAGKDAIYNGYYSYYLQNEDEDFFDDIDGGDNEDHIVNWHNKVTLSGGAGDDFINNHGNRTTIVEGTGKDQISNTGNNVNINTTADTIGDDIFSSGNDVTINAGNGNNTIEVHGENVELNIGGAGKDSIVNYVSKIKIETGAEADTINTDKTTGKDEIIGNEVTIDSGTGNDYIWNNSEKASIVSGDNNDKITNYGDSVTIDGGAHADYIANGYWSESTYYIYGGNRVSIVGGSGKNTLVNYGLTYAGYDDTEENINNGYFRGYGVTMTGGDDKDTILNSGAKASIDGGKGNDEIINSGASVTAYGGEGYNKITNNGKAVKIIGGADKDTIENSGANVTIYGGEGNESIINSGWEVSIVGGSNKTTIRNTGDKVTIEGSSDADKIYTEGATVKIDTGGGKDSVTVVATSGNRDIEVFTGEQEKTNDYVFLQDKGGNPWDSQRITINTGLGNDTVWNQGLARATINTGVVGNDSVRNSGTNVSIATGFGKDTIENHAEYVTINSGTNSDTSKDVIKNYADNVTIIGGEGGDSIQHSGAGKVSIVAGKGADTIRVSNTTPIGDFLKALIKPSAKVANEAIDQYFGVNINQTFNDLKTISDDKSTTKEKIDAVLRLRDTARPPQISDTEDKLIAATGVADSPAYKAISATVDKINKVQNTIKLLEMTAEAAQEYADSEILKKVAQEALSGFEKDDNGRWIFATSTYTAAKSIRGGLGNDKIYSDSFCFNVYEYYSGDGKDVIYNWNSNDTLEVMSGTFVGKMVGNDYVVYVGSGSITFKNYGSRLHKQINTGEWLPLHIYGNGTAYEYNRQPADNTYSEPTPPEGISYSMSSEITAENNFSGEIDTSDTVYSSDINLVDSSKTSKGVKITGGISSHSAVNASSYSYPTFSSTVRIIGGKGSDEVYSMKQGRVNSGEGNDFVFSYGDKSVITDTDGDDTIVNSSNDTTIEAGKGNDSIINGGEGTVFIYRIGDGDDTINSFNETSKLIISGGSYSSQKSQNGNDLIIKVKGGSITLVDAATLSNPQIEGVLDEAKYILNGVGDTNLTLTDSAGNDTIDNYANHVTIDDRTGNNYIHNYWTTNHVKVIVGDGDDTVCNRGSYATIESGEGNDSIDHWGSEATIDAGKGNDYISSVGWRDSISGGAGNDSIHNYREYSTINGDAGNDYIYSGIWGYSTLNGGTGKDTIENQGENVLISGGANSDSIYSYTTREVWNSETNSYKTVTVNGVTIDGGAANDSIYGGGYSLSIVGGAGNDLISLDSAKTENAMIRYKNGDGNDKIIGFNETSVLYISGSTFSTQQDNNDDIIVTVGKGKITLQGAANLSAVNIEQIDSKLIKSTPRDDHIRNTTSGVTVEALGGNDSIYNDATKVTILGGAGDDSIRNDGSKVTILGGDDNDSIENSGANVTIYGGDNNDSIENSGANVSISGGNGSDTVRNNGNNVTVSGGAGNDSVQSWGHALAYVYSGGDDTIDGFDKLDNLVIEESEREIERVLDSDGYNTGTVIVKVKDKGTITLNDYWEQEVNIVTTVKEVENLTLIENDESNKKIKGSKSGRTMITNHAEKVTISAGTGNTTIQTSGSNVSVVGGKGKDYVQNSEWTRWNDETQQYETLSPDNVTINGGTGNDTVYNYGAGVSINGGSNNDEIYNYEWTRWNDETQQYETLSPDNVTINGGSGNDSIENYGASVSINGGKGEDSIRNEASKVTILGGDNNDLIENDHGIDVSINGGAGNDSIENYGASVSIDGGAGEDSIRNYEWTRWNDETQQYETLSPDNVTINGGSGNDSIENYGASVSINGGKGEDSIRNEASKVTILGGDNNDLIENDHGIDVSINGGAGNDSIRNDATKVTILGGDDNDSIENSGANVTIYGGDNNDSIENSGANVSISGGNGSDTVRNNGNNVTVSGGAGNDSVQSWGHALAYVYSGGDDTIDGFDKLDNLVIEESEREIERVLDSDGYNTGTVIVKVKDKGTITLNDYWEQEVNIVATVEEVENLTLIENDESNKKIKGSKSGRTMITNRAEKVTISAGTGNTTIQTSGSNVSVVGGKGKDYVQNSEWTRWNDETQQYETLSPDNVTINGGTGNDTVYNYGAGVSINGGSNNDKIYNYGSNSTLNGGAGNDSLWGSDNADTFIYTSGKDVIFGFANDDLLEISGDWTAAYNESKNTIAFKVGSTASAITLKDFTATTFKINGDAYTISGKQLVK